MAAHFTSSERPGVFSYRAVLVAQRTLIVLGSTLLGSLAALVLLALLSVLDARAAPIEAPLAVGPGFDEQAAAGLFFRAGRDGDGEEIVYEAPTLASDVTIDLAGQVARVAVTQRFHNPTKVWLEGIYVFPLPDGSAVDRLAMTVGERRIDGRILEKSEAERIYRQAAAEGRKASLLSAKRPNVFVSAVANIGPGEDVVIEIGYQDKARLDAGRFTYRFPMVVAPRYSPWSEAVPMVRAPVEPDGLELDGQPIAQPIAHRGDTVESAPLVAPRGRDLFGPVRRLEEGFANPVTLLVRLDPGRPLAELKSLYHRIDVETLDRERRAITLAEGAVPADRDFVLEWRPQASESPEALVFGEEIDGEAHLLITLLPPGEPTGEDIADPVRPPRDLIFVVDTSGSMHGTSIEQAKGALIVALDRLVPGDRFNVIRFANQPEALFESARPMTADTLRRAKAYILSFKAEGGTEMRPALTLALDEAPLPGRLRQVVFMTDGAVSNEHELFMTIAERLGQARLFTIGIGSAPNSYFMRKAAELGRGSFTHIGDLAEVQARMTALFDKLERPALTGVTLYWPSAAGRGIETYPARVPDLYAGEPVVISARLEGVALGDLEGELVVNGERGGKLWERRVSLDHGLRAPGVAGLWARAKFADVVDGLTRGRDPVRVRDEALAVALRHRLVTRFTSLVAVDDQVTRPEQAVLRSEEIARNLPDGMDYDYIFGELDKTMPRRSLPAPLLRKAAAEGPGVGQAQGRAVTLPQTATASEVLALSGLGFLLLGACLLIATGRLRRSGIGV